MNVQIASAAGQVIVLVVVLLGPPVVLGAMFLPIQFALRAYGSDSRAPSRATTRRTTAVTFGGVLAAASLATFVIYGLAALPFLLVAVVVAVVWLLAVDAIASALLRRSQRRRRLRER